MWKSLHQEVADAIEKLYKDNLDEQCGVLTEHYITGENYEKGAEYRKSQQHHGKAIQLSQQHKFIPSWVSLNKICIAKAQVMNNEKDIDLEALYRFEAEIKVKLYESSMQRYIAEILLNIDDQHLDEAQDWIRKAIESDKRYGMMWHLGRDYALYAELLKRTRNLSTSRENLNKAIEIFKECGADGWVEKYEKELTELS